MTEQAMQAVGWVAAPVLTALVGWAVALLRRSIAEQRSMREEMARESAAIREGLKCVLRKQLVDAYRDYVTEGKPLTVERKHEVDRGYEAYRAIGGNGTGRDMYEAVCGVPLTVLK